MAHYPVLLHQLYGYILSNSSRVTVADFIRRLECTFWIVYGRNSMFAETPDTVLHSQLQEGLRYDLIREPAISGVQSYKERFFTAKHEEKCLAELRKHQHYQKPVPRSEQHLNRKQPAESAMSNAAVDYPQSSMGS